MRRRSWLGLPAAAALAVSLAPTASRAAPPGASAEEKQQCVDAYEQSQRLRRDGKLRAAHERLLVCSSRSCPEAAQLDCARWLAEVEQAQPGAVVTARGPGGQELTEIRVLVDGEVAADRLDGRSIAVDPGLHTLRVETAQGRSLEQSIMFREGEKFRAVEFTFSPAPAPAPPSASTSVPPHPAEAEAPRTGGLPVASYVLGGLGVAAVTVGAVLDITGKDRETTLKNTCAPHCSHSDVQAMRTQVLAGDVTLAVGLASLAGAVVIALGPRERHAARVTLGFQSSVLSFQFAGVF
jgi:hypothetical protein